jgi:hypothetical protein
MKPAATYSSIDIAGGVECTSYPQQIPPFAEREMERLHASRYSSMSHFQVYGHADGASTYVARRQGVPSALLLYRRDGAVARVLNEAIPLSADEARRFARHVLSGPDAPAAVLFRAVDMAAPEQRDGLLQRVECEQDIKLTLPSNARDYLNSLGDSTRSMLKNRLNKIKREQPSFSFTVYENEQIDLPLMRDIIALHRSRMEGKRGAVAVDEAEEGRVLQMLRRCGVVGVIMIDGRCCAGSISYRTGDVVSGRFLAHDADYDVYRLGFLCAYLMCCYCIDNDAIREFHFGWGRDGYKYQLGGKNRALYDVAIYRNWWQRLRLAPFGLRLWSRGMAFRARRAMLELESRDSWLGRKTAAMLGALRRRGRH